MERHGEPPAQKEESCFTQCDLDWDNCIGTGPTAGQDPVTMSICDTYWHQCMCYCDPGVFYYYRTRYTSWETVDYSSVLGCTPYQCTTGGSFRDGINYYENQRRSQYRDKISSCNGQTISSTLIGYQYRSIYVDSFPFQNCCS